MNDCLVLKDIFICLLNYYVNHFLLSISKDYLRISNEKLLNGIFYNSYDLKFIKSLKELIFEFKLVSVIQLIL